MSVIAQIAAVLAGLIHLVIFVMESVLFTRPAVSVKRFLTAPEHVEGVRPWAFNQGFYNLFLGLGALSGVGTVWAGKDTVGATLALFACACMLGAAVVLGLSDRRMLKAAIMQGAAPLLALVTAAL